MSQNNKPELYPELEIWYFDEGVLIRSMIDIETQNDRRNYEVPIFVIANEKFGFKVFHGLKSYSINRVNFNQLFLNRSILMMNKTNNWWVFIPSDNLIFPDFVKEKLQSLFQSELTVYSADSFKPGIDLNNYRSAFAFGLGVE